MNNSLAAIEKFNVSATFKKYFNCRNSMATKLRKCLIMSVTS